MSMLAQMTMLRYWKSEHDEETCEDAIGENTACGLFAVADGAGTTLFSDAWARFLVRHFLDVPLLSSDPFEVEWWVRLAQECFKQEHSQDTALAWNVQQKVHNQGSYATLATLRVVRSDEASAQAKLLVFGDSCIFIDRPSVEPIFSFPLARTEEFEQAPICLPSKPGAFQRYFHRCSATSLDLMADDVVVMATDAVSKWIVSAGNGRYPDQRAALRVVAQQTPASWASFIEECRAREEMVDDDCTALLLALHPDTYPEGVHVGATTLHSARVIAQRLQEFELARAEEQRERVAICFGDGTELSEGGVLMSLEEISFAREVADAQREVLAVLRQEINNPHVVDIMTPVWQKHAHLLFAERSAENIRKTLTRLGVPIEPVVPVAQPVVPEPVEVAVQGASGESLDMLDTSVYDLATLQQSPPADGREEGA